MITIVYHSLSIFAKDLQPNYHQWGPYPIDLSVCLSVYRHMGVYFYLETSQFGAPRREIDPNPLVGCLAIDTAPPIYSPYTTNRTVLAFDCTDRRTASPGSGPVVANEAAGSSPLGGWAGPRRWQAPQPLDVLSPGGLACQPQTFLASQLRLWAFPWSYLHFLQLPRAANHPMLLQRRCPRARPMH